MYILSYGTVVHEEFNLEATEVKTGVLSYSINYSTKKIISTFKYLRPEMREQAEKMFHFHVLNHSNATIYYPHCTMALNETRQ